jgi:hypothetical protein
MAELPRFDESELTTNALELTFPLRKCVDCGLMYRDAAKDQSGWPPVCGECRHKRHKTF